MNTKFSSTSERGQAIIIIALVMVVLLLFLALAIDGGNTYLHRRLAQNASDAGAIGGADRMLMEGATGPIIMDVINNMSEQNGVDPRGTGNRVRAYYIDTNGNRLDNNPEHTILYFNYVPIDQGASGIEVEVVTSFDAFVAQLIGWRNMTATSDSGAVVTFPHFCQDWVFYSNCPLGSGDCYNNAMNLSGSMTVIDGGGVHSNSGLHTTGSSFSLNPPVAEWGNPGVCNGNVCPPGGPAQQVPPEPMPVLYHWEDFQPGAYWWNDMCQGSFSSKCHSLTESIGPNDVISGGLWVVSGNINSPRLYNPGQTHYTFVLSGNFAWNGQAPYWEPFEGSSTQGGSKAFIFSTAQDTGGVDIRGPDVLWKGMIYLPNGLTKISAAGNQTGDGAIFSWRIDLSGATMNIHHDTNYCPPEQAKITLLW